MAAIPYPQLARDERRRLGDLPLTLQWIGDEDGALRLLDQTRLPGEVVMIDCRDIETVWEAIRALRVRGAPAIGVAAAYGMYLGVRPARNASHAEFDRRLAETARHLCDARPTAVNLEWAVRRVGEAIGDSTTPPAERARRALEVAHELAAEDADVCRRIGEVGAPLVPEGGGVLTHCNAGALATAGRGTALAVFYEAHRVGRRFRIYADETRPLLQGARLTAFELSAAGLDVTVLCDSMAGALLASGRVQAVFVGADRIAANGDTANKIGTYGLAVLAHYHKIPFHVAAPRSTFDLTSSTGAAIPIEERSDVEVRAWAGRAQVPAKARCWNPAFDVTPARLVTSIITEVGLVKPVTDGVIREILDRRPCKQADNP